MPSPSRRLQTKPVITCLKSLLIGYSLVFWITGVILLAVGIWGKVSLEVYFSLVNENTNTPYVLIGTGAFIVIFGLFGCFATCRGSTWMLKLYSMFLSLIFLAELVAAVCGFVFRHEIRESFRENYTKAVNKYNETDEVTHAIDSVQKNLKCCGVDNYTDWVQTEYFKQKGIPKSCCKDLRHCSEADLKDLEKVGVLVEHQGCVKLLSGVIESNLGIVAGIAFGIACFQLIGIFIACCLSHYITTNQYEMV